MGEYTIVGLEQEIFDLMDQIKGLRTNMEGLLLAKDGTFKK